MESITYIVGAEDLLNHIEPLWEQLNKHHIEKSNHFKHRFENNTYDERKKDFLSEQIIELRVELVKDIKINRFIGYCVSSIKKGNIGEVESIYLEKDYRKYGIGDHLMAEAIFWFEERKIKTKHITVVSGNDDVLGFYGRYGFQPRKIVLEQV